jgi:dGTPase
LKVIGGGSSIVQPFAACSKKRRFFCWSVTAAVRSRLTHSLEVQQVGRFITQKIVQKLTNPSYADHGFVTLGRSIESLVEMACLMHDIGNPPFGHFGEKAINDWFTANINELVDTSFDIGLRHLYPKIHTDLLHFEGNAQAIRLISSLLNLNLTYTQAASILKYTRLAYLPKFDVPEDKSYLMKKPGFYLSEEAYITQMQTHLAMQPGCRHPLSYIMEAADDISYCYADIEGAVEKGILSVQQLCQ